MPNWQQVADHGDDQYDLGFDDGYFTALIDAEALGFRLWTERQALIYERLVEMAEERAVAEAPDWARPFADSWLERRRLERTARRFGVPDGTVIQMPARRVG